MRRSSHTAERHPVDEETRLAKAKATAKVAAWIKETRHQLQDVPLEGTLRQHLQAARSSTTSSLPEQAQCRKSGLDELQDGLTNLLGNFFHVPSKSQIGARRRHRLQRPRPAPVSNCVWPGLPYTYVIASAARYPTCTCHERDATPLCQHGGTSPEVSAAHPICPGSSRRSRAIRTRRPASADWMVVEIRSFSH